MEKEKPAKPTIKDPVVPDEITALIRYASERGIDPDGAILGNLSKALRARATGAGEGLGFAKGEGTEAAHETVLKYYSQLTKLTYPVNGRTLLDTERVFRNLGWIFFWTFFFLILAVGNKILYLWFEDLPEPEEGWPLYLLNVQRYVLDYLSPFFWGGLGSCVFLLKTLSDKAAERSFDHRQLQGWGTRIVLGAVLGAVVQYVYNPASFTTESFRLDASAVAFLTGVGVKVVYGAIEKTIDVLASKMSLDTLRRARAPAEPVLAYLDQALAKTRDPDKRKLLTELIGELGRPKKG